MLTIFNAFISCLITVVTLYIFGRLIISEKFNKKYMYKDIICVLIGTILNTIVFLYLNGTVKTVLTCLVYILFFKFTFNLKISKSIFSGIFYVVLLIIPDLMMTYIPIYVFGIEKEYFYNSFAGSILGNLCVAIVMIIITYILRKQLRKIINYRLSTNKKIIAISAVTIMFVIYFFYRFANDFRVNNEVIIYLITIFAFIGILFILFKEKINNENILKKYDDLLTIMKAYESDIEEQRIFLHETKNEFKSIRAMVVDKENCSKIVEYIDSVVNDKVSSNMAKYSKFKYLPSNGLKGFFYYKFIEAEKLGINTVAHISKEIENSFLKDIDVKTFKNLGRILGVCLDNAIEASSTSEDKKMGIEIYAVDNNIEIIISNTFKGNVDAHKIGKEIFTTKGNNHGHGLLLVNRILSQNKRFKMESNVVNNIFTQKIIIKEKTQ